MPAGLPLAEVYNASTGSPGTRLVNVSARAGVGVGGNILIGGFNIGGATGRDRAYIRGKVGPGLADTFGLAGTLNQPVLTVYSGATPLYSNTIWGGDPTPSPARRPWSGRSHSIPAHQDSASADAFLRAATPCK